MSAFRPIVLATLAVSLVTAHAGATSQSEPIPVPRHRPAIKSVKNEKAPTAKSAPRKPTGPTSPSLQTPAAQAPIAPRTGVPVRTAPPFAMAATTATSPLDLSAVKQAIDLVRKNRQDEATTIESSITDPLARKVAEWVILRSENGPNDFARYEAFITANPSWPGIQVLRRRAEGVMWQETVDPRVVIAFFAHEPPHTAKGHFVLARSLSAEGNTAGASAILQDAWRSDAFDSDLEAQAREVFAGLITPADDAARMDSRLYAEDEDAALRAAQHLNAVALDIAKARVAVIDQTGNAKTLLEAVPESARRDPGYIFSRVQWLRRSDKIPEAAQLLITAPRDPASLGDVDQWWVERRLVARKLLDLNEPRLAYEVVNSAAVPNDENFRAEQHFTAGWIALRFLHEPSLALPHFARIADGVVNPITLARSYYWQARAAEALGREQDADSLYRQAASYPTAFYGQLARARLGLDEVTLQMLPEPAPEHRVLEISRVFEILYAVDEND
ncbi:MAG: lytic transglycosylase domain-containing protein, partial [Xanthobacteraceae bacterium]